MHRMNRSLRDWNARPSAVKVISPVCIGYVSVNVTANTLRPTLAWLLRNSVAALASGHHIVADLIAATLVLCRTLSASVAVAVTT